MSNEGNLLVLDWDFWFPNPMEWNNGGKHPFLYDWGHAENQFMIHSMWTTRAAGFLRNGLPLPKMDPSWKTFVHRLNIAPGAEVIVHESNAAAGADAYVGYGYENVWLFDAHHDLYKYESLRQWQDANKVGTGTYPVYCEDWMFVHADAGSHLEWRFPATHGAWQEALANGSWGAPSGVDLYAQADDGEPIEDEFDRVFICRSGAWVPSWCDDEFDQFVATFDKWDVSIDPSAVKREFDIDAARAYVEATQHLIDDAEASNDGLLRRPGGLT